MFFSEKVINLASTCLARESFDKAVCCLLVDAMGDGLPVAPHPALGLLVYSRKLQGVRQPTRLAPSNFWLSTRRLRAGCGITGGPSPLASPGPAALSRSTCGWLATCHFPSRRPCGPLSCLWGHARACAALWGEDGFEDPPGRPGQVTGYRCKKASSQND